MNVLTKLITVKSLVTLSLTAVVIYLAVIGRVDPMQVYLTIIAFYFGTQHERSNISDFSRKE